MPLFPLPVALCSSSARLIPLVCSTQPHLPVENLLVSDCRPPSFCLLSLRLFLWLSTSRCATRGNIRLLQQCLSMLFVLNRSPYLEALPEHLLMEVATEGRRMRHMCQRIAIGLYQLQILQPPKTKARPVSHAFEHSGMAREWYEWSVAWYEQEVDLTPHQRRQYLGRLLAIGRWLSQQAPRGAYSCTVD